MHLQARPTSGTPARVLDLPAHDADALVPLPPWFRAAVNLSRPPGMRPVSRHGVPVPPVPLQRRQAARRLARLDRATTGARAAGVA